MTTSDELRTIALMVREDLADEFGPRIVALEDAVTVLKVRERELKGQLAEAVRLMSDVADRGSELADHIRKIAETLTDHDEKMEHLETRAELAHVHQENLIERMHELETVLCTCGVIYDTDGMPIGRTIRNGDKPCLLHPEV